LQFNQLEAVTGGTLCGIAAGTSYFRGVSIDSRTVTDGNLFVAIHGERDDGHKYIDQALTRRAAGVMVDHSCADLELIVNRAPVLAVDDTHRAMIILAAKYRDDLKAKFVAVTGSNGKTTTKEFIYQLLQAVMLGAYRSPGNLNNLFGVPLSIFAIPSDCRIAVLELGISTADEMPRLAALVRPSAIVITNVGPSHLEFLDTIEDVAQAKLELVRKAEPTTPVIVNGDDRVLLSESKKIRPDVITFSIRGNGDFCLDTAPVLTDSGQKVVIEDNHFELPLPGNHQVENLLAAYAVVRTLGFNFHDVDTTEIKFQSAPMRGQLEEHSGVRVLLDCYNANPDSVKAGLQTFDQLNTAGRKIVLLGDMLELGNESEQFHREIGRLLADYKYDRIILVGTHSAATMEAVLEVGCDRRIISYFRTTYEAVEGLTGFFNEGDLVYIKGSRGMGMESILETIESSGGGS